MNRQFNKNEEGSIKDQYIFQKCIDQISKEKIDLIRFIDKYNFKNFDNAVKQIEENYLRVINSVHQLEDDYNQIIAEVKKNTSKLSELEIINKIKMYQIDFIHQIELEEDKFVNMCKRVRSDVELYQSKNN